MSNYEQKCVQQAREQGYVVAHFRNPEQHKRISNAWWRICEKEKRYYVRVDVAASGNLAHIYVDSGTVDNLLPLVTREEIDEIFRTYMREGSALFGEKVMNALYGLDLRVVDELAARIVGTFEQVAV